MISHWASAMKKPSIPLGLVFSQSGPYAMMGCQMQNSALMAVDEINEDDEFDFTFAPHLRDPGGGGSADHTGRADLIRRERGDHIVRWLHFGPRHATLPLCRQ